MDDPWSEVERMAQVASATDALASSSFPTNEQLARWENLFSYSRREALQLIIAQRSDVTRIRITDEHWSLVQGEKERLGHDRETYEHSLQLGNLLKSQSGTIPGVDGKNFVLFRLGGLLGDRENVKEALGSGEEEELRVVEGRSEMGVASFFVVDEEARGKLELYLVQTQDRGRGGRDKLEEKA